MPEPEVKPLEATPSDGGKPPEGGKPPDDGGLFLGRFKTQEEAQTYLNSVETQAADAGKKLKELEGKTVTPPAAPPPAGPQLKFWDNPEAFIEEKAAQMAFAMTAPLIEGTIKVQKDALKELPHFKESEEEIDKILAAYPRAKAEPGIVQNVYNMVVGMHPEWQTADVEARVQARLKELAAEKGIPFVEGGSERKSDTPKLSITEEERRHAKAFDMTDADYVKYRDL